MSINGKQIRKGIKFLEAVLTDFQMVKSNEDYCGYINISAGDFNGEKLNRGFELVVTNYLLFTPILEVMGLRFEARPRLEETIIHLIEK